LSILLVDGKNIPDEIKTIIANKKKDFDCVEMKNEIQAKIYAETKNMSIKKLLAYFNNRHKQDTVAKIKTSSR
jgi:Holliday junction resolvase